MLSVKFIPVIRSVDLVEDLAILDQVESSLANYDLYVYLNHNHIQIVSSGFVIVSYDHFVQE